MVGTMALEEWQPWMIYDMRDRRDVIDVIVMVDHVTKSKYCTEIAQTCDINDMRTCATTLQLIRTGCR